MTTTPDSGDWFKSSYSDNQGGACVEGAHVGAGMAVRDSKDPARGAFVFQGRTWGTFLAALKEDDAHV